MKEYYEPFQDIDETETVVEPKPQSILTSLFGVVLYGSVVAAHIVFYIVVGTVIITMI